MSDLNFQNLSSVQSGLQPSVNTIASAATIAPTANPTKVSGTTQIATITPPVTGNHLLCLIFTNASPGVFLTTGNVKTAIAPTQNVPVLLWYDATEGEYYGGELKTT